MWNLNHIWQLWNTLWHMHPCSVNWRNFKRLSASRTFLTDWTAANTLHIYADGCWVITKCLSETERCAKIQDSIPSQQHNSKRSKGLTIITFHIFSYQHNSLRKCESWDTSHSPVLIFTDVIQMHVLTNFLNSWIYDNFYKYESRKSSCSTVNAECIWLHLRKPQRLNVWSKVQESIH